MFMRELCVAIAHSESETTTWSDVIGILISRYLEKGQTINNDRYIAQLVCLKQKISKKTSNEEENSAFLQIYRSLWKVDENNSKNARITLQMAPTFNILFWFSSQRVSPDFKCIVEIYVYFAAKKKSFCNKCTEIFVSLLKQKVIILLLIHLLADVLNINVMFLCKKEIENVLFTSQDEESTSDNSLFVIFTMSNYC